MKFTHKKRKFFLKIGALLGLVLLVVVAGFFIARNQKKSQGREGSSFGLVNFAQANYEKCFFHSYSQNGKNLSEFMYLNIVGDTVSGNKKVSADTYSATGTLSGTIDSETFFVEHHYAVNDFPRIEKENYTINSDGNLVKHEYLLFESEETGMLFPDTTKAIGSTIYYATNCKE